MISWRTIYNIIVVDRVHLEPSDTDLTESKIIAVLNRLFLRHRDLVDAFLYGDTLQPDSPFRVAEKLARLFKIVFVFGPDWDQKNRIWSGAGPGRFLKERQHPPKAAQDALASRLLKAGQNPNHEAIWMRATTVNLISAWRQHV